MSQTASFVVARSGLFVALVFCTSGLSGAEDKPAPAPAEDAIAPAKRDFEAIKAMRDPALQQKGEVPRVGVPDLRTGTSETGSWSVPKSATTTEKKSANWLIEAMEKPQDAKKGLERGKLERDRAASARDGKNDEKFGQRTDQGLSENTENKTPVSAPNPFARYLGSWMTPHDYALLKPGLEQSGGTQIDSRAGAPSSLAALSLPVIPGTNSTFGQGAPIPATSGQTVPRDNPYLAALSPPPAIPAPIPSAVSAITSAPAVAVLPPLVGVPQTIPAKSAVPDFVKPATDEKYFKQLKRF